MIIDDTNCTVNSRWHLAHNIRQTVSCMDEIDREQALVRIQAELLTNKDPDPNVLKYVTTLLKGSKPRNGISKRNGNGHH